MSRSAAVWRWIREQLAFLVVLAGLVGSFGYLLFQPEHWVRGTAAIAVVTLLAAVIRAVLPTHRVGMLAVRRRWLDTVLFTAIGVVVLLLDIRFYKK